MSFIPDIEADVPLPKHATEAFPELSVEEEILMRARTIKFLADLTQTPLHATIENQDDALALAKQMMEDPQVRPDYSKYADGTMAYLAGLVASTNTMLVKELADLKIYIVNKLIMIVEHPESQKNQLTALRSLGEVSGVDAFIRRTEMTVNIKPIQEVEAELKSILDNIEYTTVAEYSTSVIPQIENVASE